MKSGLDVRPLVHLRIVATSVWAFCRGIASLISGRVDRSQARVEPGDFAPDFELPGSDGRTYRLSHFRGRKAVVLAWLPKAFSSGCAAECSSLERSRPSVDAEHCQYFAATMDSAGTNREFAEALRLGYPILSDMDGRVARAYGVLNASGFPSRWTFFIAPDGRVTAVDRHVRIFSHGRDVTTRLEHLS